MKNFFTLFIITLFLLVFSKSYLFSQTFDKITEESLLVMPEDSTKMELLSSIAWQIKEKEADKALRYVIEGLEIANQLNLPHAIANLTHDKGIIYWQKGDYELASKFFFEAMTLRETLNDKQGLARSYNNIGLVFFEQEEYTQAYQYYTLGLDMRKELKDSSGLIYSFNNIADIFFMEKNYSKALKNYKKALQISKAIAHKKGETFVLENLGLFYKETFQMDSAMFYLNKAYFLAEKIEDKGKIASNLNEIAKIKLENKEYEKALELGLKSRKNSLESNAKEKLKEACVILSGAYAGLGDYEKAYIEMKEYTKLSNELLDAAKQKAIIEYTSKYQTVKHEAEILSQKTNMLEQEKKVGRLSFFIIFLFLFVAFAIGIGFYTRYKNNIRNNEILKEKNALIESKNKELVRSNSSLEQFAYVASHDLKEPLRNISSFSSLLERNYKNKLDSEANECIDFITSGVKHMDVLLEDVLAYSRLTQNTLTRNEQIDLNKIIDKIKVTLSKVIKEKNVDFTSDPLPTLQSNHVQMYQLLQNLISNGIKFNAKVHPSIHVGYKKENGMHLFSVTDNGIGIEKEYKDKIFQIFQRLHKKGDFPGTGIGLAICKKIVDQHGGEIWFESKINEGTSFHFSIEAIKNS